MARPPKEGLDYFPLYVDIFEDEKIEAVSGEFGIKGELTIIKLLCAIYKKGYFIVWDDLIKAQLLKRLPGVSKELLNQIVDRLVLWGFFNKDLFNSAKVLTSVKIQENYFEATKRRKTPKPTLYIIDVDINKQVEAINVDINTQSKVKESKVNKSKEKTKENSVSLNKNIAEIAKLYEDSGFGTINLSVKETLVNFNEQFSIEWIREAFKIASDNNKHSLAYVNGILENWNRRGKNNTYSTSKNKKTKFHNFEQLTDKYSEDDLEDLAKKKRKAEFKRLGIT